MVKWLDSLNWVILLVGGSVLMLAPFSPEPHLIEKLRLFSHGDLVKPIDIFDLLMHSSPMLLMGIKVLRQFVFNR